MVHTSLQGLLQVSATMSRHLLRSRILGTPRLAVIRHGNGLLRLHTWTATAGLAGYLPHMAPEPHDFIQDHFAHLPHIFDDLEVEVEGRWACGLIGGVVPDGQVAVLKSLFNGDAAGWVEGEHAVEKIESVRVGVGEETCERYLRHKWEITDIVLGSWGANAGKCFFIRRAEVVENLIELIDIITTFEEWSTTEEFGEDTANGPNIDCRVVRSDPRKTLGRAVRLTSFRVTLEAQHDLRRTIPPRRYILRHVSSILLRIHGEATGQSKITDLELAVGVDEQIARLEITVQNICRVYVFQATKNLIDEGLEMGVSKGLPGANDGSKIAFHEFCPKSVRVGRRQEGLNTFVEISLVKVVGTGDVHIVETCYLVSR